MLGNPESKPPFFSDKALEPVIKAIVKKFPSVDTKSNTVSVLYSLQLLLYSLCYKVNSLVSVTNQSSITINLQLTQKQCNKTHNVITYMYIVHTKMLAKL